eukprot:3809561-Pyramimonas_sp.AAC.1
MGSSTGDPTARLTMAASSVSGGSPAGGRATSTAPVRPSTNSNRRRSAPSRPPLVTSTRSAKRTSRVRISRTKRSRACGPLDRAHVTESHSEPRQPETLDG